MSAIFPSPLVPTRHLHPRVHCPSAAAAAAVLVKTICISLFLHCDNYDHIKWIVKAVEIRIIEYLPSKEY